MCAAAIVVAGGAGERLGVAGGKQLALLAGKPVVAWAVEALDATPAVEYIVVVCHPERVDEYRRAVESASTISTPCLFVAGGDTRQDSVARGLAHVPASFDIVVVHDGARPLAASDLVEATVRRLVAEGLDALVVGHPSADTIKEVEAGVVVGTPDRARLWAVQTPQVFRARILRDAHSAAALQGHAATDDAALVELAGGVVEVYEGPRDNIKVTVPEDLVLAEALLAFRLKEGL